MSGWGAINDKNEHPNRLQKLDLPILSNEDCKSIKPHKGYFTKRLEWRTFCAGYVNSICLRCIAGKNNTYINSVTLDSTAPCNGDSGSPLVFKRGDKYFLRGLVSESINHPSIRNFCNPEYPAIFTDVALYRAWIKTNTENELLNYDTTSTPEF